MKFISSTGGAENLFANVSIGYAQGMYYLSSSGLECKVEKQAYDRCEKLRHKWIIRYRKNYYKLEAKNWQIGGAWKNNNITSCGLK